MSSVMKKTGIFASDYLLQISIYNHRIITPIAPSIKRIPVKIILAEDNDVSSTTTEEYQNNLNTSSTQSPSLSFYPFSILKSRKKEKKYLRKKFNTIISRVHNMDCLLKKIKAKFLKFIYINIKQSFIDHKIELQKFDQSKEVRNLNVKHNRDQFINLRVIDVLLNNNLINSSDSVIILKSNDQAIISLLTMKIKIFFQFYFLHSTYFKNWLKDPIKIDKEKVTIDQNKNCEKFPNHSKNIFKMSPDDYHKYKKLLLHTASNFIFYFQNNPLKFGKKNSLLEEKLE